MSILETKRKMTSREQTAYDLGFHEGRNAATRRGRWEWDGKHFYCANCAGTRFHDLTLGMDAAFCPYCGAKMDGERKDE